MANQTVASPYRELPWILFSYIKIFVLGGFTTFFMIVYFTFDEAKFAQRQPLFQRWIPIFWLTGIGGLLLSYLYFRKHLSGDNTSSPPNKYPVDFPFNEESLGFLLFLAVLGMMVIEILTHMTFKLVDLLTFLLGIIILLRSAQQYAFYRGRPAWYHPTTAGNIIQSAAACGLALGLWVFRDPGLLQFLSWLLIVLIGFEMLTLWSRLRYLNRHSPLTRQTVLLTLNRYLMLFAVRFIFGMVMPLIYLLWHVLFNPLPLQAAAFMVLAGEFSERILFFITALPARGTTAPQQP